MSVFSVIKNTILDSASNIAAIGSYGAASLANFQNIGLNALSNGTLFYGISYANSSSNYTNRQISDMGSILIGSGAAAFTAADDYLKQNEITKNSYFMNTGVGALVSYVLGGGIRDTLNPIQNHNVEWEDRFLEKLGYAAIGGAVSLAASYFTDYSVLDFIRGPGKILAQEYNDMQFIIGNNADIANNLRQMATLLTMSTIAITSAATMTQDLVPLEFKSYAKALENLLVLGVSSTISGVYLDQLSKDIERALLDKIFNQDNALKLTEMKELDPAIQKLHIHIANMSSGVASQISRTLPTVIVGLNSTIKGGAGKATYTTFLTDMLLSGLFNASVTNLQLQKNLYAKADADINNHMLDATHHMRPIVEMDGLPLFANKISEKSDHWKISQWELLSSKMGLEGLKAISPLALLLVDAASWGLDIATAFENLQAGNNQERQVQILGSIASDLILTDQLGQFITASRTTEFEHSESRRLLKDLVQKLNSIEAHHEVLYKYTQSFKGLAIKDLTVKLHDKVLSTIKNLYIPVEEGQGKIIAVTGDSGCGKSTVLSVLKGLSIIGDDISASGEVYYGSERQTPKVKMMTQADYLIRSATLAQVINYPDPTNEIEVHKIANILDSLEDPELAKTEGGLLSTRLNEYHESWNDKISGGQKKKIKLAKALSDDSDIILLDEIMTGLDDVSQTRAMKTIKNLAKNKLIIIVDHEAKNHQKMMNGQFYDAALKFAKGGETKAYDLNTGADISHKFGIPAELELNLEELNFSELEAY